MVASLLRAPVELLRVPIDITDADGPTARQRAHHLIASTAVAVAMIAILNLADIITTQIVLAHTGATESNPLASALLAGGRVGLIKAGVLLALILRIPRRAPTVAFHAVLWFVAGFYFLTVVSNLLVLHRVG